MKNREIINELFKEKLDKLSEEDKAAFIKYILLEDELLFVSILNEHNYIRYNSTISLIKEHGDEILDLPLEEMEHELFVKDDLEKFQKVLSQVFKKVMIKLDDNSEYKIYNDEKELYKTELVKSYSQMSEYRKKKFKEKLEDCLIDLDYLSGSDKISNRAKSYIKNKSIFNM